MKFILYFTVLLCFASAKKHFSREDNFVKVHKECQAIPATRVDEATLEKLRHGENIEDENIKAHVFCQNVKLNLQDKSGEINRDQIKSDLTSLYYNNNNKINEIIDECTSTKPGQSKFEVALNIYKCLHKYIDRKDFDHLILLDHHNHGQNYEMEREQEFEKANRECQSVPETRAEEDDIHKLKVDQYVDNESLRNHINCMSKKVHLVNENGEINKQIIKKDLLHISYSDSEIEDIIKECSTKSNEDSEVDFSFKLYKCLRKYLRPHNQYTHQEHHSHGHDYQIEREQDFIKANRECQSISETRAEEDDIRELKSGHDVDNQSLRKHIYCMSKKVHLVHENGELNTDVIKKDLISFSYSESKIEEIIKKCSVKSNEDSEIAFTFKLFKCLQKYWRANN